MKLLFFLFSFLFCFNVQGENSVDSFFNRLKTPNGASVRIIQDERIVTKMKNEQESAGDAEQKTRTAPGYRVQVFSSNAPRTAKNEASRIATDFKTTVKDVPVYVSFTAPFWKVRAGNCRSYQEAIDLMNRLKTDFPARKNSMFIVRDNVKIML